MLSEVKILHSAISSGYRTHMMELVLGTFARGGIEALWGCDLATGARTAIRQYARHERSGQPKCLDGRRLGALRAAGLSIELSIDRETEETLERRAREHGGITVEELAAHAVLVYLADRDAQPTASAR